eukprot:TRINITY_DN2239_c0_g1_i4.p1 TRINITY_DN2239_c0_g1~~TRINITY_DN2239_c0_g1_i4.p1  ORF type:complete len:203 (+),score=19.63 TRINITY_DN2239_c0_g1_i4:909-1517(+)
MPNLIVHIGYSDEKSKNDTSNSQNTVLRNHSTMQKLKSLLVATPDDAAEILVKVVFGLLLVSRRIFYFACSLQDSSSRINKTGRLLGEIQLRSHLFNADLPKDMYFVGKEVVLGIGIKDLGKRVKKSRSINMKVRAPFKDSFFSNSRNRNYEEYISSCIRLEKKLNSTRQIDREHSVKLVNKKANRKDNLLEKIMVGVAVDR